MINRPTIGIKNFCRLTKNKKHTRHNMVIHLLLICCVIAACSSKPSINEPPTLADIDNPREIALKKKVKKPKKTKEDIRQAYSQYINTASSEDVSRQKALTRLAQLELELSESLTKESSEDAPRSQAASQALERTIALLETTLKDYPDNKDNDKVLYQLAQAYDRNGNYQDSLSALDQLAQKFPQSLYYTEAQFRRAESAFARTDYIDAEDAYTEVLLSPSSERYYEKSLFKRGWARYKQELYHEAIDDYVDAIIRHEFHDYAQLNDSEKTQFAEYFRALGLAFAYQYDQISINEYFSQRKLSEFYSEEKKAFQYIYETYAEVSKIYLKQERFSDAAKIFEDFIQEHRNSRHAPQAEQKIIAAWQKGGFIQQLYEAIDNYYLNYHPQAKFWQGQKDPSIYEASNKHLRKYITQISSYFHSRYQTSKKTKDANTAEKWYKRYLKQYAAYANQDKIHSLYAELLATAKREKEALKYFELAAFDGDIILDKKSAYASIALSANAIDNTNTPERLALLDKHLLWTQRYVDLYANDKTSSTIVLSASKRAFHAKRYNSVIALVNALADTTSEKVRIEANTLKARSFLELNEFADAEAVYSELLSSRLINKKTAATLAESMGLAIYRQGEAAAKHGDTQRALSHYTRIYQYIPTSPLAATGIYDAIALAMKNQSWSLAIELINTFKTQYPQHPLTNDVVKKLSVAYLNSNQQGKAAQELENIAKIGENIETKRAAQWQAAQLYENKNNVKAAIRAYRDYAHRYPTPYEQNMESMFKLSQLYKKTNENQKRYFWQNRIRRADEKATKRTKTERTQFIASTTVFDLAKQKKHEFDGHQLVEPLEKNLRLKKISMQESVKLFGLASAFGIEDITTESTHAIGDIYYHFSQSLLNSERPKQLNPEELEQYDILLEDQAFPFEEKAIEFYETNLIRTRDGTFNQHMQASFQQLIKLFPVRYERKGKLSAYE